MVSVKGIVDEVREASRQQTLGIDQVAKAIAQMEKVTQTTAAKAEESAAASEELNAQADEAMAVISRLEWLVGGVRTGDASSAPARTGAAKPAAKAAKLLKLSSRTIGRNPSPDDRIPMDDTGPKQLGARNPAWRTSRPPKRDGP